MFQPLGTENALSVGMNEILSDKMLRERVNQTFKMECFTSPPFNAPQNERII